MSETNKIRLKEEIIQKARTLNILINQLKLMWYVNMWAIELKYDNYNKKIVIDERLVLVINPNTRKYTNNQ